MSVMIFGGTAEGRALCEAVCAGGRSVVCCVATEYGAALLEERPGLRVIMGRQTPDAMRSLMKEIRPEVVVDATHPYSLYVTENILKALEPEGIPYIRVERELNLAENSRQNGRFFDTIEEAAEYLNRTEGRILITTGSKQLDAYCTIRDYQQRCILRALPSEEVLQNCLQHGFPPENLILMQGPFSLEMNIATIRQTGCRYLMTRNSGSVGGFPEKAEAAERTGTELIIIGTPKQRVLPSCGKKMNLKEALKYFSGDTEKPEVICNE